MLLVFILSACNDSPYLYKGESEHSEGELRYIILSDERGEYKLTIKYKGNPEGLKNVLDYSFSFETSQFAGGGTRAFDENEDIPNPRVFRDSGSLDNSLHLLKDEKIDVTVKWGEQIEAFTLTTNKE